MICIIPARKGSKRIKNKNIVNFFGKPILTHVIENLKKSRNFEHIIVSTNSMKIAKIAEEKKVNVFFRDEKLSGDLIDTKSVIIDVLKNSKLTKKTKNDKIMCVYPCSVFLKTNHINMALKKLNINTSFVFSAKKFNHPIERSFILDKNNKVKLKDKLQIGLNTQSFAQSYHDAAQFYLGWKKSWLKNKTFFDKKSKFILFEHLEAHDIDNPEDLDIAKKIWKINQKST